MADNDDKREDSGAGGKKTLSLKGGSQPGEPPRTWHVRRGTPWSSRSAPVSCRPNYARRTCRMAIRVLHAPARPQSNGAPAGGQNRPQGGNPQAPSARCARRRTAAAMTIVRGGSRPPLRSGAPGQRPGGGLSATEADARARALREAAGRQAEDEARARAEEARRNEEDARRRALREEAQRAEEDRLRAIEAEKAVAEVAEVSTVSREPRVSPAARAAERAPQRRPTPAAPGSNVAAGPAVGGRWPQGSRRSGRASAGQCQRARECPPWRCCPYSGDARAADPSCRRGSLCPQPPDRSPAPPRRAIATRARRSPPCAAVATRRWAATSRRRPSSAVK